MMERPRIDKDPVALFQGKFMVVGLVQDASLDDMAKFKFIMPVPWNIRK